MEVIVSGGLRLDSDAQVINAFLPLLRNFDIKNFVPGPRKSASNADLKYQGRLK